MCSLSVITEERIIMSIYNKTLAAAAQTSIPTVWCKIFAQSLLNVENRLGITLDVVPREDKCLWIKILSSGTYTADSEQNLDIVGFDYHEDLEEIFLITVVGFRNYWYNVKLYKKLLANPKFIAAIENAYKNCLFERQIRFNKFKATFYQTITRYDTLGDYLAAVGNAIYFSVLPPADCIKNLAALGVTEGDAIDKLNNYHHDDYNWLEYLHIVSKTPINCKLFLNQDPATIAEFERQIEQYLNGMILIDDIYK